ncbi:hypothetical protein AVEN_197902-1 [Araneus ventricosus]|uniref:Uncharacterized protein n=1 Tax=Araneus ventricosus TaxID=182803 RepID=A0A4Y2CL91_ARAVE|nr:hypothetical protein AVEN_197902-1 [Araneus ventricosus]
MASNEVNCFICENPLQESEGKRMSQEIGCTGISKIIGRDFYTIKFKRNDRIKLLGVMNAGIQIGDLVPINPLLIFQRMCIAKESEKELEKFFTGTCDNSQVPSYDSDEEEETEAVFEQTYDGIKNEEDRDEYDNPIAEEISVCDVSIDTEDDELATPGPSTTAKRRR